jgi:hypothetical protein
VVYGLYTMTKKVVSGVFVRFHFCASLGSLGELIAPTWLSCVNYSALLLRVNLSSLVHVRCSFALVIFMPSHSHLLPTPNWPVCSTRVFRSLRKAAENSRCRAIFTVRRAAGFAVVRHESNLGGTMQVTQIIQICL